MKDCIFCQIVQGTIPCARIYETEDVLAFLDISPVIKGHTLVIPKTHVVNMLDLPGSLAGEMHLAMQKLGQAMMDGLKAGGFNLGMNNFKDAGQLVMHAHYHLIPRFAGDGLSLWAQGSYRDNDEMQKVAQEIKSAIPS